MNVRFSLTQRMGELAGFDERTLQVPEGASLSVALAQFASGLVNGSGSELLDNGRLHASILVVVNGRACRNAGDVSLNEDDEIQLMLPVAGG